MKPGKSTKPISNSVPSSSSPSRTKPKNQSSEAENPTRFEPTRLSYGNTLPAPGSMTAPPSNLHTRVATPAFLLELFGQHAPALNSVFEKWATQDEVKELKKSSLTLEEYLRVFARGVSPNSIDEPLSYARLLTAWEDTSLEHIFQNMMEVLPRETLIRLREGKSSAHEVFSTYAKCLEDIWNSRRPLAYSTLVQRMRELGREQDLNQALRLMSSLEKQHLELGKLSGLQVDRLLQDALSRQVDCFIGGAGAAGTKAANDLMDQGFRVVVAEARSRVGGRAHTDKNPFGFALDHGCAYLHNPDLNPMTPIVRRLGLTELEVASSDKNFVEGKWKEDDGSTNTEAVEFLQLAKEAAKRGRDISVEELIRDRPDLRLAAVGVATATFGADPSEVSVMDVATKAREVYAGDPDSTSDKFIKEGLGTVVAAMMHGVPVLTSTPITHIKQCDDGYEITAGGKRFFAKKVLLTLPPAVLLKNVVFEPPLPEWKKKALADLPMGNFKKIILQVGSEALKDFDGPTSGRDPADPRVEYIFEVLGRPDTVFAMTGGALSNELKAKGTEATVAEIEKRLEKLLDTKIDPPTIRTFVSTWDKEEESQGSYSVAKPGAFKSRRVAGKPVKGLYFAGEAYDTPGPNEGGMSWQTYLPGAWRTGAKAAQAIAAELKTPKVTEHEQTVKRR